MSAGAVLTRARRTAFPRWGVAAGLAFAAAFVARLSLVLVSPGGPSGNFGYDSSVYYAAADALTHGRLPYQDFLLLHPPAMMLALTPFAVLGRLTTDHTGYVVANTAFSLLASVNAALVVWIARRAGLPLAAGLLGGLFYAVWYGAVIAEITARLEPLGSFAFLCALLALTGRGAARRRSLVLAGVALGVAVSVKIWWVAPALVLLAWQLRSPAARRAAAPLAVGALAAVAVVDGPFFALAPRAMWRMVVTDQLGRHGSHTSPLARLDELSSLRAAFPHLARPAEVAVLLVVGLLFAGMGLAAWRCEPLRPVVLVAATQLVVLLAAPTYFFYYSGYLAAPAALVVAAAAAYRVRRRRTVRFGAVAAGGSVAVAAAATVITLTVRPVTAVEPFPGLALSRDVTHVRCLMADSPMALIELDALNRDFADHCPNWVDVSGRTYDVDAPHGRPRPRHDNSKWQVDARRYLLSGTAVILIRPGTGLSPQTRDAIDDEPVLARAGGYTVHRVAHRA